MNSLSLAIFICCTIAFSSAANELVNLCTDARCCGTGMHTPATDGTYTGANDHLYTIFDPRADSEETWDNWNLRCLTSGQRSSLHNLRPKGRQRRDMGQLELEMPDVGAIRND